MNVRKPQTYFSNRNQLNIITPLAIEIVLFRYESLISHCLVA